SPFCSAEEAEPFPRNRSSTSRAIKRAVGVEAPNSRSMSASSTNSRQSGMSARRSGGGQVACMPQRYAGAAEASVNRQSVVGDDSDEDGICWERPSENFVIRQFVVGDERHLGSLPIRKGQTMSTPYVIRGSALRGALPSSRQCGLVLANLLKATSTVFFLAAGNRRVMVNSADPRSVAVGLTGSSRLQLFSVLAVAPSLSWRMSLLII